jgi:hypothetical protein
LYQFSASWDLPGKDHFSHKQEIMAVTVFWEVLSHPEGGTLYIHRRENLKARMGKTENDC